MKKINKSPAAVHTHRHSNEVKNNEINLLRKNLKLIIVIAVIVILGSSLSVFAYSYLAKDIKYTKKDGKTIDVESALDELYSKSSDIDSEYNYSRVSVSSSGSFIAGIDSPFTNTDYWQNNGWGTLDYQNENWIALTYTNPINIKYIKLYYGGSKEWCAEGNLSIQASNDGFKTVKNLKDVHLSFDEELKKQNKYLVYWEGSIDNNDKYLSYRIYGQGSSCYTGVNKLQLTYIRFYQ